jgi:hypothetical protein
MSIAKECSCQSARLPVQEQRAAPNSDLHVNAFQLEQRRVMRRRRPPPSLGVRKHAHANDHAMNANPDVDESSILHSRKATHTESSKRPICIGSRFSPAATMGRACKFSRPAGRSTLDYILFWSASRLKIACRGLRAAGQRDGDGWICSYSQKCGGRALFANMRLSQSTFFVGKFSRLQTYQAAGAVCAVGLPQIRAAELELRRQLSFAWKCGSGRMKLLARIASRPTRAQTFSKANSSGGFYQNLFSHLVTSTMCTWLNSWCFCEHFLK